MGEDGFDPDVTGFRSKSLDVYAGGAAFYTQLVKAGYLDEAAEFAEWFLETFDLDLET